jgi:hypothetical protein
MKLRLALGIGALSCFAFLPAGVFGQSQQQQQQGYSSQSQGKKEMQTVTGCLSKGQKPGEYTLTTQDGVKYNVFEKSEKLSKDVGNTVTITGHEWQASESGQAGSQYGDQSSSQSASQSGSQSQSANSSNMNQSANGAMKDLRVSHYTVVSQGCNTGR